MIRFDSILVRLEGPQRVYRESSHRHQFRFHTGSIRSLSTDEYGTRRNGFDSILVRLEAKPLMQVIAEEKFRFHTGSIRREEFERSVFISPKFRFHTGSIRSKYFFILLYYAIMFRFHTGSIRRDEDQRL